MTTPDAFRDAEHFADVSGIPDVADFDAVEQPRTPAQQDLRQKVQRKTKIALIDRLLRELDVIIYCELAALYYMEYVSFVRSIDSMADSIQLYLFPICVTCYCTAYILHAESPTLRAHEKPAIYWCHFRQ